MGARHGAAAALVTLVALLGGPLAAQQQRWISRKAIREATATKDTVAVMRAGRVDTVAVRNEQGIRIAAGEVLVVPTKRVVHADSTAGEAQPHVDLPNRYILLGTGGQLLNLQLRVAFSGRGLRYDRAAKAFIGELIIGLEDTTRQGEQVTLSTPIQIQVTGEADGYEPGDFGIAHTNLPYVRVRIRADSPKDTVQIVVQPTFDPTGVRTPVPVERLPIQVVPSPPKIQGFGLQTASVVVTVTGAPDGVPVVLGSTQGRLDDDTLSLPASGVAKTRVRSEGLGTATVRANLGLVASGFMQIEYTIPWTFLLAAVLGGGLGAFIRRRREQTRNKASKLDLPLGIGLGLLGAVAYALGVNLTGLDLSVRFGEAATFLVATVSAALDLPGLGGLRAKFASGA